MPALGPHFSTQKVYEINIYILFGYHQQRQTNKSFIPFSDCLFGALHVRSIACVVSPLAVCDACNRRPFAATRHRQPPPVIHQPLPRNLQPPSVNFLSAPLPREVLTAPLRATCNFWAGACTARPPLLGPCCVPASVAATWCEGGPQRAVRQGLHCTSPTQGLIDTRLEGGGGGQGEFRIIQTQGGGEPLPPKPPPPPPQTKGTIVGKNEIYRRENLIGPFLVHKHLGPKPPQPPLKRRPGGRASEGGWVGFSGFPPI